MFVHRSNRMETLVDELADVVRRPLDDPFARECILVQGRGIERWLAMELARRLDIWANPDFPFPRHFFERLFDGPDGSRELGVAGVDAYDPGVLAWCIAALLPGLLERREFDEVRSYLERTKRQPAGGTDVDFSLLALSERLATLFDQYVVYRPQWVANWERGADTHWQAQLWREIHRRQGPEHVTARAGAFLKSLHSRSPEELPQRVSVFGLSTLPPLYLDVLAGLAARAEVHLFLLSPSQEYWAWIRSQREVVRRLARDGRDPSELHAALQDAAGNPLLASMGRVGRDFQQILESKVDYQDDDHYAEPATDTLLGTLQADILHLRHRRRDNPDTPALPARDDESIRVHVCHSPMREVEVLYDQLLDLFERDRSLEPRDVLVMSPAVDTYAPFIDAVFGAVSTQTPPIPYRIADRKVRSTDDVIDAFLVLLATLRGRFTAPEVMDLLGRQPVYGKFGIVTEQVDVIREWIRAAGIRWAVDAEHRAAADQPPLAENTWRFGLDRLLLGYAMTGKQRRLFEGVLPFDDMEGSAVELLGKLSECCERLFEFRRRVQAARTLAEWRGELTALLDSLLASTDETAYQHRQIRAALGTLEEQAKAGGFDGRIDLDSLRVRLEAILESGAPGRSFMTGGVTFCAMVPMRSVPFRVICLLGLNDDTFPRVQRPLGFDRMAEAPQPGDRSSRDDDRYLFLEALLSARERLLITYVGQSIRDNAETPPSVVVSELLDVIDESFTVAPDRPGTARDQLLVRHPLQPFSRRYFRGEPNLFSYSPHHLQGARHAHGQRIDAPPFVHAPLPDAGERLVNVDDLAAFFERPCRAFLQRRLGLSLGSDLVPLDDREPLELDGLDQWKLGTSLVSRALDGDDLALALPSVRASGTLPPGELGTHSFEAIVPVAAGLAHAAERYTRGAELDALEIDGQLVDTRVVGVLTKLWPEALVQHQYSKLGSYREIGLWIRHLLLNWAGRPDTPRTTILIGRGGKGEVEIVRFTPVADAAAILGDLIGLYWLGQRLPLPLFANASRAYVEKLTKTDSHAKALEAAAGELQGDYVYNESHDDYYQQIFANNDPFAPVELTAIGGPGSLSFADVAERVLGPLLAHREVVE